LPSSACEIPSLARSERIFDEMAARMVVMGYPSVAALTARQFPADPERNRHIGRGEFQAILSVALE